MKRTYEGQKEIGHIDAARLGEVQAFYRQQNLVRTDSPLDTLYTNAFVDQAKL